LSSAAQAELAYEAMFEKASVPIHSSYAQSKLALTMWSFSLAKQLPNITVIPVNPGSLLDTRMVREGFGKVWSPAEKGGDIIYNLAVGEKHKEMSGKYFDNDKGSYGDAHPDTYDNDLIRTLIEKTEAFIGHLNA